MVTPWVSEIPEVAAVSVCPTWAVPVTVSPVAVLLV